MSLPERKTLVHKPVEFRNLSKTKQGELDIYDDEKFVWELKYDGCHTIIVVAEGEAKAYSRQGEPVESLGHLLEELSWGAQGVYFAETWAPDLPHSEINGAFRRKSTQEHLGLVMFDYIPLHAFEEGEYHVPYDIRRSYLQAAVNFWRSRSPETQVIVSAQVAPSRLEYYKKNSIPEGFALDGFVAKQLRGSWIAGAGRGGEAIKVKDILDLDLQVVALKEGEGKFKHMTGSLVCQDGAGKRFQVSGGCLTYQERQLFWKYPGRIHGTVVQVHALGVSAHGDLREARFIRTRPDKTAEEIDIVQ